MTTADVRGADGRDVRVRNAVKGAWLGFFVDMFDIYLPIVVLAPALIYFIPQDLDPATSAIVGGSIFAATLIGRPIGAFIFGHYADTIGRKRSTLIAVGGFGTATLIMAFLPGYEHWGMGVVVVFVLLRLVAGVFLGGEYTSASPLAMEYSPKEKRGLYGSFIMTGYPLAYAAISLITMLLLFLIPAGGLDSPYVQWGWRIPFFVGAMMAGAFVVYYARSVRESELWEQSSAGGAPLKQLFRGQNLRNFVQVFVLMSGFWLTLYTTAAMLPGLLRSELGLSGIDLTLTLVIAYIVLAVAYVATGEISQRFGRRPFLMWIGVTSATLGTFLYWRLISAPPQSFFAVVAWTTVIVVIVTCPWGLATVYINERFHTSIRASGFGLGYSLAVILPAFYAWYQAALATVMPFKFTPLPLLVIGALLILLGAAWGPETKDVDFAKGPEAAPRAGARGGIAPELTPQQVALQAKGSGSTTRA